METCNHPRVRVLTREDDAEFVECLECGEVFDSHEFTDMAIEERTEQETEENSVQNGSPGRKRRPDQKGRTQMRQ